MRRTNYHQRKGLSQSYDNCFVDMLKSLNLKDPSDSNIESTANNTRHSFKNVSFKSHVSIKIMKEKKTDNVYLYFQPIST